MPRAMARDGDSTTSLGSLCGEVLPHVQTEPPVLQFVLG